MEYEEVHGRALDSGLLKSRPEAAEAFARKKKRPCVRTLLAPPAEAQQQGLVPAQLVQQRVRPRQRPGPPESR